MPNGFIVVDRLVDGAFNMIVKSCMVEEHVKDLEEVFAKIRKYNL